MEIPLLVGITTQAIQNEDATFLLRRAPRYSTTDYNNAPRLASPLRFLQYKSDRK